MSSNARAVLTRIQTVLTFILFVAVEFLIAVVFHKNRVVLPHDAVVNVYSICFIASMPALVGVQGIRLVQRLSSRSDITDITNRKLNDLFLTGIGVAYVAVVFVTIVLAESLR